MPDFLNNQRSDTGTWAPAERREHKFPINRRPDETATMVTPDAKSDGGARQPTIVLTSDALDAFGMVHEALLDLPMSGCVGAECRERFERVTSRFGSILSRLEPAAPVAASAYDLAAHEAAQPDVQAAGPAASPDSTVNPGRRG